MHSKTQPCSEINLYNIYEQKQYFTKTEFGYIVNIHEMLP